MKELEIGKASNTNQNNTKTWLVVYYSTFFGRRLDLHDKWSKHECPVPCEITSDPSRASEADGIAIHDRDAKVAPPVKSVPWILQIKENPVHTPALNNAEFMPKYNSVLQSYRLDSDFPNPVFPMPKLTAPLPFKEKTGLVMAAFSNCEPVRTAYLKQLMQYVQVDSYGACHRNKNNLVNRYGSANGKNFKELKTELARKYKFLLVFFNQDCDYFVDDQLTHALNAGSVPVVMGTDKLDDFLPGNLRHAVIKVRDFKSPKLLAEHLKFLIHNETEYNKYLEWKQTGIGNITGTVIGNYWKPKYPIYCQICVALSKGRVHKDGLPKDNCQARKAADWGLA